MCLELGAAHCVTRYFVTRVSRHTDNKRFNKKDTLRAQSLSHNMAGSHRSLVTFTCWVSFFSFKPPPSYPCVLMILYLSVGGGGWFSNDLLGLAVLEQNILVTRCERQVRLLILSPLTFSPSLKDVSKCRPEIRDRGAKVGSKGHRRRVTDPAY